MAGARGIEEGTPSGHRPGGMPSRTKGLPGFPPTQKSQEARPLVKAVFLQEKKEKEASCLHSLTWHGLGLVQRAESQAPPCTTQKRICI